MAGNIKPDGYRVICMGGRQYYAHRLAWLYMTGEWPIAEVDHINTKRGDDRFANLREATHAQNSRNRSTPCTNTSGVKGVSWHAGAGKWCAFIKVNSRSINLGYFTDIPDAAAAYAAASERLHGEFGRAA